MSARGGGRGAAVEGRGRGAGGAARGGGAAGGGGRGAAAAAESSPANKRKREAETKEAAPANAAAGEAKSPAKAPAAAATKSPPPRPSSQKGHAKGAAPAGVAVKTTPAAGKADTAAGKEDSVAVRLAATEARLAEARAQLAELQKEQVEQGIVATGGVLEGEGGEPEAKRPRHSAVSAERQEELDARLAEMKAQWDALDEGDTEEEIRKRAPARNAEIAAVKKEFKDRWAQEDQGREADIEKARAEVERDCKAVLDQEKAAAAKALEKVNSMIKLERERVERLQKHLATQVGTQKTQAVLKETEQLRIQIDKLQKEEAEAVKAHAAKMAEKRAEVQRLRQQAAASEREAGEVKALQSEIDKVKQQIASTQAELRRVRQQTAQQQPHQQPQAAAQRPPAWQQQQQQQQQRAGLGQQMGKGRPTPQAGVQAQAAGGKGGAQPFKVGDPVSANYGGEWHPATIRKIDYARRLVDVDWAAEATYTNDLPLDQIRRR
eukprot:TRINITY_DN9717_c0_g2_i2.p1 TRINITY_DN9717_c0_g2~~TRINITY_DN9717_c0_g2_i2.p1  ORF type:complete len:519 (+),score=202.67 TRINITY_DN9717_c0_g2_i2:81-1559(+)